MSILVSFREWGSPKKLFSDSSLLVSVAVLFRGVGLLIDAPLVHVSSRVKYYRVDAKCWPLCNILRHFTFHCWGLDASLCESSLAEHTLTYAAVCRMLVAALASCLMTRPHDSLHLVSKPAILPLHIFPWMIEDCVLPAPSYILPLKLSTSIELGSTFVY
jgi:hypothetical protein